MKKKVLVICIVAFFCTGTFVFAQAKPKAVLAKADIDIFIKNYAQIQEILGTYSDELSSIEIDSSEAEGKALTDLILKARGFSASAKLRAEFTRLGLGNNGLEKCLVILFGLGATMLEDMVAEIGGAGSKEADNVIKNQVNPIKAAIHANDYKLIQARKDELFSVLD